MSQLSLNQIKWFMVIHFLLISLHSMKKIKYFMPIPVPPDSPDSMKKSILFMAVQLPVVCPYLIEKVKYFMLKILCIFILLIILIDVHPCFLIVLVLLLLLGYHLPDFLLNLNLISHLLLQPYHHFYLTFLRILK